MVDYWKDIPDMDGETLTKLLNALTKENNERKNKKRLAIICKIKNMLSEIDDLCLNYDINITTDYEYLTDDRIYLKDLSIE